MNLVGVPHTAPEIHQIQRYCELANSFINICLYVSLDARRPDATGMIVRAQKIPPALRRGVGSVSTHQKFVDLGIEGKNLAGILVGNLSLL